jgi:thioesterase domain-containing protein
MDRLTNHCVAAIRTSDVAPPYRIAGTSFGGLVAYDVAMALRRAGLETEYVGLFDTPAPWTRRRNHLIEPLRRFRWVPKPSARRFPRQPREELRRAWAPFRRLLASYSMTLSLLLRLPWRPRTALRFRHLRIACSLAANRWEPPASDAPVHIYRCQVQRPRLEGEPHLGWERHAAEIRVRSLPFGHGRHIRPPEVSYLAAAVNEDLKRA